MTNVAKKLYRELGISLIISYLPDCDQWLISNHFEILTNDGRFIEREWKFSSLGSIDNDLIEAIKKVCEIGWLLVNGVTYKIRSENEGSEFYRDEDGTAKLKEVLEK